MLTFIAWWFGVSMLGTIALCGVRTVIRNRRERLHEFEDYNQFRHDRPRRRP